MINKTIDATNLGTSSAYNIVAELADDDESFSITFTRYPPPGVIVNYVLKNGGSKMPVSAKSFTITEKTEPHQLSSVLRSFFTTIPPATLKVSYAKSADYGYRGLDVDYIAENYPVE